MARGAFIIGTALIVAALAPWGGFAQEEKLENLQVGVETGTQLIVDIPITHFEDADTWSVSMPVDQGIIQSMSRRGKPSEVAETDPNDGTKNVYTLGVKVMFNQRGYARYTVAPPKPIKVPGITKALTVWVTGRNFKHRLFVHIYDYKGSLMVLDMGLLDFSGWRKRFIPIPTRIEQDNYHNTEWRGISIAGFSVETDPAESYGVLYMYLDELRAISDIYSEEHRDQDDMQDGW